MTYAEFGEAIGRSAAAARAICVRKRWKRIVGNDGKAKIAIPLEVLEKPRKPRPNARPVDPPVDDADGQPVERADARSVDSAVESADTLTVVAILREQVARLEEDLERTRTDLDEARAALEAERVRAAQVEVLTVLLEIERKRAEEAQEAGARRVEEVQEASNRRIEDLKAERDRWAAQAERLATPAPPERRGFFGWLRRA